MKSENSTRLQPMRVQVSPGSPAERYNLGRSALPGGVWPMPKAIAPGVHAAPLEDLIFHGGKTVAQMQFQNIFLGSATNFGPGDIESIDTAITLAMRDARLDNVISQYFPGSKLSCDALAPVILDETKPTTLDELQVQAKVTAMFDAGLLPSSDLGATIFNFVLPPGAVLVLGDLTSLQGLGGYHGSTHIERGGKRVTLYYSANVYSEPLLHGDNGIIAFDAPWKNVVGTLYHELNEFRTDADVSDAILQNDNDFLGWMSRSGREIGDQPIAAAASLDLIFQEVAVGARKVPVQFMYSNAVHGAEGPIDAPHR